MSGITSRAAAAAGTSSSWSLLQDRFEKGLDALKAGKIDSAIEQFQGVATESKQSLSDRQLSQIVRNLPDFSTGVIGVAGKKKGFLHLKINEVLERVLLPLIKDRGFEKSYFAVDASHMTIITNREMPNCSAVRSTFRGKVGKKIEFTPIGFEVIHPKDWKGVKSVAIVNIASKELEKLRTSFGLQPTREKDRPFQIQVGIIQGSADEANASSVAAPSGAALTQCAAVAEPNSSIEAEFEEGMTFLKAINTYEAEKLFSKIENKSRLTDLQFSQIAREFPNCYLSKQGTIKQTETGFTYLAVDKFLSSYLLSLLEGRGFTSPPVAGIGYHAHATIITNQEMRANASLKYRMRNMIGHEMSFSILGFEIIQPNDWKGVKNAAIIKIASKGLEALRTSFRLQTTPYGFPFQITVGIIPDTGESVETSRYQRLATYETISFPEISPAASAAAVETREGVSVRRVPRRSLEDETESRGKAESGIAGGGGGMAAEKPSLLRSTERAKDTMELLKGAAVSSLGTDRVTKLAFESFQKIVSESQHGFEDDEIREIVTEAWGRGNSAAGRTFTATIDSNDKGFTYAKVEGFFQQNLLPLLKKRGFIAPPFGELGSHISVITNPEVREDRELRSALNRGYLDGREITYQVTGFRIVEPERWKGIKKVAMVTVASEDLENLRTDLKLQPKPNGHDPHITVGVIPE